MPFGHPCWHSLWSASEALGDACIPLRKGKPRLCVQFKQTRARANYIWHLYYLFESFVGTPPRVDNFREIRFRTFSHPELKFYYALFYPAH